MTSRSLAMFAVPGDVSESTTKRMFAASACWRFEMRVITATEKGKIPFRMERSLVCITSRVRVWERGHAKESKLNVKTVGRPLAEPDAVCGYNCTKWKKIIAGVGER